MPSTTIAVGELLYEITIGFTKITEYGVSIEALATGQVSPPPEGGRVDVHFEGHCRGSRVNGTVAGVDYIQIRADGRIQLHIHAELTTDDGEKISIFADGVATPEEGTAIMQLRENVTLSTSSPAYSWVNQIQVWGQGTVDLAKSEVNIKVYAA